MTPRGATVAGIAALVVVAMTGCSSSSTGPTRTSRSPSASLSPTAASPAPAGPSQAVLEAIYARLYPGPQGADCATASGTVAFSACPVTPRLATALRAAVSAQSGPGDDPLCGCQAFDPQQSAAYTVGAPPGGGTIRISSFGAENVAYVVVASGGAYLVDDIVYCTPSPHSVYPAEPVSAC